MGSNREATLLNYYVQELAYLRTMGADFAERYPSLAGRLDLSDQQGTDPHVERLLEAFAFLTGRIQYNIDSEASEIPSALLDILYPHLQTPIPSMAIAQFELDSSAKPTTGLRIERETPLFAPTQEGLTCWFRTCYPVTLWPLEVGAAGLVTMANRLALGVRLAAAPGVPLNTLKLDRLRFYLQGSPLLIATLYELLFSYTEAVYVMPASADDSLPSAISLTAASRLPAGSVQPVGFDVDEAVLPYPSNAHPAYRLLQEYFAFPKKFNFFEIANIDLTTFGPPGAVPQGASQAAFAIYITFRKEVQAQLRELDLVKNLIHADTFCLGCTPVINLFHQITEPVRLDHTQSEYLLIPDVRRLSTTEIHSIESVVAVSGQGTEIETLAPLYGLNHTDERTNRKAFWHARRLPSSNNKLAGTEMWLAFTDLRFNPKVPDAQTVYARARCTNRNLAEHLPPGIQLQIEQALPLRQITCLDRPTPEIMPPLRGAALWRLVSHLSLNHLSLCDAVQFTIPRTRRGDLGNKGLSPELRAIFQNNGVLLSPHILVTDQIDTDTQEATSWLVTDLDTGRAYTIVEDANQIAVSTGQEGLNALRAILQLYAVSDDLAIQNQILGIEAMACRRVVKRVGCDAWGGFGRGIEITLTFDKAMYHGQSPLVLAGVLNQFFSLYVSANMFTQLIARRKQAKESWKTWEPMAGGQIVL